jgi:hypothetical protein
MTDVNPTPPEAPALLCYKLAAPGAAAKAADPIARVIRRALGVADPTRHVIEVTPWSGWVRYYDRKKLWQERPAVLPAAEQARAKAETWLRTYAGLLANNGALPDEVRSLQLAPSQAKPQDLMVLSNTNGTGYDHWLYRAQPVLSVGAGQPAAAIMGGAVEIRIGDGGDVVGFSVRWRALTGEVLRVPRAEPVARFLDDPPDDPKDTTPPEIVYVLDGEFSPQAYLSPFYLRGTGHEISFSSASPASLTIDFYGENTSEATELTAIVAGGSGNYDVHWGLAPLERPFELQQVGEVRSKTIGTTTASTIAAPVGAYLVVIDARDRLTGATVYTQQYALSGHLMANGDVASGPRQPSTAPSV